MSNSMWHTECPIDNLTKASLNLITISLNYRSFGQTYLTASSDTKLCTEMC